MTEKVVVEVEAAKGTKCEVVMKLRIVMEKVDRSNCKASRVVEQWEVA